MAFRFSLGLLQVNHPKILAKNAAGQKPVLTKMGEYAMCHKSIILFAFCLFFLEMQSSYADATRKVAYRGSILHFIDDPKLNPDQSTVFFQDGLLVVDDGLVVEAGPYQELWPKYKSSVSMHDYRGKLIMPGFIDTHTHYPQAEMIAAYGEQLLEWLNTYTFPTERKYKDYNYARQKAVFFLNQLVKNGTTTALVFCSVHPESVEALFDVALERNMRLIGGKVMMDRNAPEYLLDTAASSYQQSRALIKKWHGKGRLSYAITPRFAPTSTPDQLKSAQQLKNEFPDVYIHTHLSENPAEIAWVKELFPDRTGYLDVYDHYKLTGKRSIFAHSIHLTDAEISVMQRTRSVASFCPTSNLFLGSGHFPYKKFKTQGIRMGIGTDVGAGTSFSILETLNEAYKVVQMDHAKLSALDGFYLATLGGARALSLDDKIGNFLPGKEADFVVIDPLATDLLKMRFQDGGPLEHQLFALMMLGDERHIAATYIAGKLFKFKDS